MSTNMEELVDKLTLEMMTLDDPNKSSIKSTIKSTKECYNKLLVHKENLEKRKKGYTSYSEEMKDNFNDLKNSLEPIYSVIKGLELHSKYESVKEVSKEAWTSFKDFYDYLMNLLNVYKEERKVKKYGGNSDEILTSKGCVSSLETIEKRLERLLKHLKEEKAKAKEIRNDIIFLDKYVENANDILDNSQKILPKDFKEYEKFCSNAIKQFKDIKKLITADIIPEMTKISENIQAACFAVNLKEKSRQLAQAKKNISKINKNINDIKNGKIKSSASIFNLWRWLGY